jgi:hypothetical protein
MTKPRQARWTVRIAAGLGRLVLAWALTGIPAPGPAVAQSDPTATPTSCAEPSSAAPCVGSCDGDETVTVGEIVQATNIALGLQPLSLCEAADGDGGGIGVTDLLAAVINSMTMCGRLACPTATLTPSITPTQLFTATPTRTPTPTPTRIVCGNGVTEPGETCDDGGFCLGDSVNISCEDRLQDCPNGRRCENRFCLCQNDQHCEGGQSCVDGQCILRCTASEGCPSRVCRPAGGDGCAANCTAEDVRATRLETLSSPSRVQTTNTVIDLNLAGVQRFRTGRIRDERVVDPQNDTVTEPGEMPVVIKADSQDGPVFDPVPVPGLVCACIRQIPVADLFGPNNSGVGKIGCGTNGLTNIDYKIVQDHNTDPRDPNNGTTSGLPIPQLPDDPECDDTFTFPSGVVSSACAELSGNPICNDPTASPHRDVCNSPRQVDFTGGQAPRGSALIDNSTAIGLLQDAGICRPGRIENGQCNRKDYGADCVPCTADDLEVGTQENLPTTTGTAEGAVYDASDLVTPGFSFPVPIDKGSGRACSSDPECAPHERCRRTCEQTGFPCSQPSDCPNDLCRPPQCEVLCGGVVRCLTAQTGHIFDCDALIDNPLGGLTGAALAVTFPDVDARQIGDNVTASILTLR